MERTLVLLKPDALQRGLIGRIIDRLENRGLKLVGIKMLQMDMDKARVHYQDHIDKSFFMGLANFITSGPIVALAIEGPNAVGVTRETIGATDPQHAAPGTIRGDLGMDIARNLIHGSDSISSADRELLVFFAPNELLEYTRQIDTWIIES